MGKGAFLLPPSSHRPLQALPHPAPFVLSTSCIFLGSFLLQLLLLLQAPRIRSSFPLSRIWGGGESPVQILSPHPNCCPDPAGNECSGLKQRPRNAAWGPGREPLRLRSDPATRSARRNSLLRSMRPRLRHAGRPGFALAE